MFALGETGVTTMVTWYDSCEQFPVRNTRDHAETIFNKAVQMTGRGSIITRSHRF